MLLLAQNAADAASAFVRNGTVDTLLVAGFVFSLLNVFRPAFDSMFDPKGGMHDTVILGTSIVLCVLFSWALAWGNSLLHANTDLVNLGINAISGFLMSQGLYHLSSGGVPRTPIASVRDRLAFALSWDAARLPGAAVPADPPAPAPSSGVQGPSAVP